MKEMHPSLPPAIRKQLAALEGPQVLGASKQLALSAELLRSLAREYEGESEGLIQAVQWIAHHLIRSRGDSSQAITNGIRMMVGSLSELNGQSLDQLRARILSQVEAYETQSQKWMRDLVSVGANLLRDSAHILVYDYSSSVAAILHAAGDRKQPLQVVLPEARTLDGGRKYFSELKDTTVRAHIIPDAAIAASVRNCDLALAGAETLSAEGGCFNTIGTLGVAMAARYWRVPFYVASTLIKIDLETLNGVQRPIPTLDLQAQLLHSDEAEAVGALCPDLDYTPPHLITGLITEIGLIPPAVACQHALRLQTVEMERP